MGEIPEVRIGETEAGEPIYRRVMTEEHHRERLELNVETTASRIRARALAATNGNGKLPHRPHL